MSFDFSGKYESPAYGTVSVIRSGSEMVLTYHANTWTLQFKGDLNAEFIVNFFGFHLPLPVQFEVGQNQKVKSLSIPFSLDPRVPTQTFTAVT